MNMQVSFFKASHIKKIEKSRRKRNFEVNKYYLCIYSSLMRKASMKDLYKYFDEWKKMYVQWKENS